MSSKNKNSSARPDREHGKNVGGVVIILLAILLLSGYRFYQYHEEQSKNEIPLNLPPPKYLDEYDSLNEAQDSVTKIIIPLSIEK